MKKVELLLLLLALFAFGLLTNGCGRDDGDARPGDKGTFTLRGSGSSS